ncbi:IS3 family transposase [Streptomyces bobili]|uniref:IS3 family transposase n=1 Tax=Streptomyces bobili TaxID=67280 RepID=UPI0033A2E566
MAVHDPGRVLAPGGGLGNLRPRGRRPGPHQTECIRGRIFTTRAEVNLALFEYIDGFYNSGASRNGSVTSGRSSSRRGTTPIGHRPDERT